MYVVVGLVGIFAGFLASSLCGIGAQSDLLSKLQYLNGCLRDIDADTKKEEHVALCSIHRKAVEAIKIIEEG